MPSPNSISLHALSDKEASIEEKNLAASFIPRYAKPTSLQMGYGIIHQETMVNEEELSFLF